MGLLVNNMKKYHMLIVDRLSNVKTVVIVVKIKSQKDKHRKNLSKISVIAYANVLGISIMMTGKKI